MILVLALSVGTIFHTVLPFLSPMTHKADQRDIQSTTNGGAQKVTRIHLKTIFTALLGRGGIGKEAMHGGYLHSCTGVAAHS